MRRPLFLALVAAALLLAACSKPAPAVPTPTATPAFTPTPAPTATPSPTPDPMRRLEGLKIGLVLSGTTDDAGWTASAAEALRGLRQRYGLTVDQAEGQDLASGEAKMRDYIKGGYQIILAHGAEWDEVVGRLAREFPQTRFIQTNGSEGGLPNLYTVTFAAGEGGYFTGMLACLTTKTNKIGYLAGTSYPIFDYELKMAKQACQDLGKTVELAEAYIESWYDVARAKELATAAIENQVDVLITHADTADAGVLAGAAEAKAAGKSILIVPWSRDKHALAPELATGGWEERVPRLIEFALERIAREEGGGHFALGLRDRATGFGPFYGLVPQDVERAVTDAVRKYTADPASIPTLQVRTDL